jgi:hypothetical protein
MLIRLVILVGKRNSPDTLGPGCLELREGMGALPVGWLDEVGK